MKFNVFLLIFCISCHLIASRKHHGKHKIKGMENYKFARAVFCSKFAFVTKWRPIGVPNLHMTFLTNGALHSFITDIRKFFQRFLAYPENGLELIELPVLIHCSLMRVCLL